MKSATWSQIYGDGYDKKKPSPWWKCCNTWMIAQRELVQDGVTIAKALD